MATWQIDPTHSNIEFAVKHMVVATVRGRFNGFQGTIEAEAPDFSDARLAASADVASLNTGVDARDQHLKSPDFFDAASHPSISFESTGVRPLGDGRLQVDAQLTIRGATLPLQLIAEPGGEILDPYGLRRTAFHVEGTISRKAYGLSWNNLLDGGAPIVADAVKLVLEVQATTQVREAVAV